MLLMAAGAVSRLPVACMWHPGHPSAVTQPLALYCNYSTSSFMQDSPLSYAALGSDTLHHVLHIHTRWLTSQEPLGRCSKVL